jgi:hypothetical protein
VLVTARGIGKGYTLRLRRDGEEDLVGYQAKLRVQSVEALQ